MLLYIYGTSLYFAILLKVKIIRLTGIFSTIMYSHEPSYPINIITTDGKRKVIKFSERGITLLDLYFTCKSIKFAVELYIVYTLLSNIYFSYKWFA